MVVVAQISTTSHSVVWLVICCACSTGTFHLLKNIVISPVGFAGNLSLWTYFVFFVRGLSQMEDTFVAVGCSRNFLRPTRQALGPAPKAIQGCVQVAA